MQLENKVALITGGNSGIGLATARLFSQEGATLVIAARNQQKGDKAIAEIESTGGRAIFVQCDVRSLDDCQRAVDSALKHFGRLDILVNNAGVVFRGRMEVTREQDWDEVMDINVKGVFLMCKAALPALKEAGRGVILTNASDAGLVGEEGLPAYCASKAAVVNLTRTLAIDYAADGIRANAVCPGATYVERWEHQARAGGYDVHDQVAHFVQNIPLRRVGDVEEVAQAFLFLASDAASFITGVALPVDGGNTAK